MENAEPESRIVISKRKADDEGENQEKRLRVETQAALAIVEKQGIARSSTLLAPTMLLTGHQAAVYTLKFDPSGLALASAGADRAIFLWDTRGECNNYNVLRGHKNVSVCDWLCIRKGVQDDIRHHRQYGTASVHILCTVHSRVPRGRSDCAQPDQGMLTIHL